MALEKIAQSDLPIQIVRGDYKPQGIDYGFFTKEGGVSEGGYASLNVGTVTATSGKDTMANVQENIRRAMEAIGATPEQLCLLESQYNNSVAVVTEPSATPIKADGLVSNTPGIVLANVSADAHSIAFVDEKSGVVGLAVGSWKGVAKGVVENVIASMESLGSERKDIHVIVGPGLSKDSYEMGKDVHDFFVEGGTNARDNKPYLHSPHYIEFFKQHPSEADKFLFDLPGLIAFKAQEQGLLPEQVQDVQCDTLTDERFFGARRFTKQQAPGVSLPTGAALPIHLQIGRNLNFVTVTGKKDISPDGIRKEQEANTHVKLGIV